MIDGNLLMLGKTKNRMNSKIRNSSQIKAICLMAILIIVSGCVKENKVGAPIAYVPFDINTQTADDEQNSNITINPAITAVIPSSVYNNSMKVEWVIEGNSLDGTQVTYDTKRHDVDEGMIPADSGYAYTSNMLNSAELPATFSTEIELPENSDALYLRIYGKINERSIWSSEYYIRVIRPYVDNSKTFFIEADDDDFYPDLIHADYGDDITIFFRVKTTNTEDNYQFSGTPWGTTRIVEAGETVKVQFSATDSFEYKAISQRKILNRGQFIVDPPSS